MIMRCLTHITLVTVIQFIACSLAGWGNAETIFMLFFIVPVSYTHVVVYKRQALPVPPDVMQTFFPNIPVATPTTFLVNVNTLEALPLLQGATDAAS